MEAEIEELKLRLQQVHESSTEIERELELEIEAKSLECQTLRAQLEEAATECLQFKQKFEDRGAQLRLLESRNEELEERERILQANLSRLEGENENILERLALSTDHSENDATVHVELQRALQNLQDALDEITRLEKLAGQASNRPNILNKSGQIKRREPATVPKILQTAELRSKEWKQLESGGEKVKPKRTLPTPELGRGHGEKIQ